MESKIFLFLSLITVSSTVVIFGHIIHGEFTESRELGNSCENDLDCLKFHFAICNENKKCECIDKFTTLNGSNCVPLIGGYCWNNYSCLIKNTVCVKNACKCKPTYAAQSNRCVPSEYFSQTNHDLFVYGIFKTSMRY